MMDTQEYLAEAEEMLGEPIPPGATVVVTTTGTPGAVCEAPCFYSLVKRYCAVQRHVRAPGFSVGLRAWQM